MTVVHVLFISESHPSLSELACPCLISGTQRESCPRRDLYPSRLIVVDRCIACRNWKTIDDEMNRS